MVRSKTALKFNSIFLCLAAIALLSSCTQNKGTSTVKITIPDFSNANSKAISQSVSTMNADGGSDWGLGDPSLLSEFKCFGVFVGGPDSGLDVGKAHDPGGALLFSFGLMKGLAAPGGSVSLSVPSGTRRTISIIGFALAAGAACESIDHANGELTGAIYSAPFLLGQVTRDLTPGDMPPISMTVSYTPGVTKKIGEVYFPNSGGGSGSNSGIYTGSGTDGNITITSNDDLSILPNSGGSLILASSAGVKNLMRPNPTTEPSKFKVQIPTGFSANHFGIGDEIMLYIYAERSSTGGPGLPGGCGNLWSGFRVSGKVLSAPYVASSLNYVDVSFSDSTRVGSIPTANLYAAATASDFCRASINRVPNIEQLTLAVGTTLTAKQFTGLSGATSEGGVLFMRVRDRIQVSGSSGVATISMSENGYRGGGSTDYPGEGQRGLPSGPTFVVQGAGGGGGMFVSGATPYTKYPGGGGHGGEGLPGMLSTGGALANGGQQIGDQYGCGESVDLSARCLMGKIFMGGGGGVYTSASGSPGGGVISIFANNIVLAATQSLHIRSTGKTGGINAAGGAGGGILLRAMNLNVPASANLTLEANGGHAGDTTSNASGAGGGGRVHVDIIGSCSASAGGFSANVLGGVSGQSPVVTRTGNDGTKLFTGPAMSQATCSHPLSSL